MSPLQCFSISLEQKLSEINLSKASHIRVLEIMACDLEKLHGDGLTYSAGLRLVREKMPLPYKSTIGSWQATWSKVKGEK